MPVGAHTERRPASTATRPPQLIQFQFNHHSCRTSLAWTFPTHSLPTVSVNREGVGKTHVRPKLLSFFSLCSRISLTAQRCGIAVALSFLTHRPLHDALGSSTPVLSPFLRHSHPGVSSQSLDSHLPHSSFALLVSIYLFLTSNLTYPISRPFSCSSSSTAFTRVYRLHSLLAPPDLFLCFSCPPLLYSLHSPCIIFGCCRSTTIYVAVCRGPSDLAPTHVQCSVTEQAFTLSSTFCPRLFSHEAYIVLYYCPV